jgi:hypothetical protein
MNSRKKIVVDVCALFGAFALSFGLGRVCDAAEVCGTSGTNNPRICVDWNETGDPELDFDFSRGISPMPRIRG